MNNSSYRGVVVGKTIVLMGDVSPLPEGSEVIVLPVSSAGNSVEIMAAVDAPPHLTQDDIDEFELAIAQGRRQRSRVPDFSKEPDAS